MCPSAQFVTAQAQDTYDFAAMVTQQVCNNEWHMQQFVVVTSFFSAMELTPE